MNSLLAKLINNRRIPKIIRFIIVCIPVAFIEMVAINLAFKAEMLAGNIFGFVFAVIGLLIGISLIMQIIRD